MHVTLKKEILILFHKKILVDLVKGAIRVRQREYEMNPKYFLMVRKKVDKLLENGFIYPMMNSKRVNPIVIVPKKIGYEKPKIRTSQDFKKLNSMAIQDHYPILASHRHDNGLSSKIQII